MAGRCAVHFGAAGAARYWDGRPEDQRPTHPTFAAGLVAAGLSPYRVQHLSSVAQDYLDGVFSGTNNLVEVIGGTKPRTIEDSVAATRSLFDTDGAYGITDARLAAA